MPCPRCGALDPADGGGRCPRCGILHDPVATATRGAPATLDAIAREELNDRFAIGAVLAPGVHALRYLAEERETGGRVVLRVFALDALRDLRLVRPVEHALLAESALDHPHLLAAYRSGTTAHLLWSATPHVEGRTLARALAFGGPLSAAACVRLVRQLVAALHELHQRGLVHGAIAPVAVLVGEDDRARVTDIAVDRLLEDAPGFIEPTRRRHPAYTAPEVARGAHPAPAEDQFGLAVTVCECLTGPWPIEGNGVSSGMSADALVAHVMRARPDLPAAFRTALRRALSPRPADRFPDVRAFGAALDGVTAPAGPAPTARPERSETANAESPHVIFVNDSPARLAMRVGAGATLAGFVFLLGALQLFRPDPVLPRLAPAVVSLAPDPDRTRRASGGLALPDPFTPAPGAIDTLPAVGVAPPDDAARGAPAGSTAGSAAAAPRGAAIDPDRPRASAGNNAPPRDPAAASRRTPVPAITYAPSPGRLFVSSRPWGQLYVDGQLVGNTPISSLPLAAGTHRVRITREGFAPEERQIVVESGRDVRLVDIILRRVPP